MAKEKWEYPTIYEHTVVIDGKEYPRCIRALGIVRCTGHVTDPSKHECEGHGR